MQPDATQNCMMCPYSNADQYMATLNLRPSEAWRDMGIFLVFTATHYMLVYFFIYTVRVKGWSFGFGALFRGLGFLVEKIKAPFQGMFKKKDQQE